MTWNPSVLWLQADPTGAKYEKLTTTCQPFKRIVIKVITVFTDAATVLFRRKTGHELLSPPRSGVSTDVHQV